jgi:hypothetical protein
MSDNGTPIVIRIEGHVTRFQRTLEEFRIRHIRPRSTRPRPTARLSVHQDAALGVGLRDERRERC